MILRWLAFLAALTTSTTVLAESADHYRGGWLVEGDAPRIYQFVLRGSEVTGYACGPGADGTTLAPLEGSFDPVRGLLFTVRYLDMDGAVIGLEHIEAKRAGGRLELAGTRVGANRSSFR